VTASLIFLGYLPKKLAPRPDWLACPNVEFVASVSECISRSPPDRIDHWKHNYVGLYDTEALARAIIPEDKLTEYTVFAHCALPVAFHDGQPIDWNPWADEETIPPKLDTEFNEHLGFDIVGYTNGGFFECSPLSCNGVAKNIGVNRFCLVEDIQRAMTIAKDFSRPESRVEPAWAYVIISVWRRGESK
jgi:hypothetical protein